MWPFSYAYPESHVADIDDATFDYIVVGGGTAGCALAARLSEDLAVSVLLIERGATKDHLLSRIPLLSQNTAFKWTAAVTDRFSEPIAAFNGRRLALVSGDGLGGATRINGMMMTRGIPGGYAQWAETETPGGDGLGLAGWGWRDVEPYFRKMETAVKSSHAGTDDRGHSGPMAVRQIAPTYEFFPYMAKACAAVGLPAEEDADCNASTASAQGYFRVDLAVNADGTRLSTNRAYLSRDVAVARRGRLTICTEALATKLQLSDDGTRVTGVHVQDMSAAAAAAAAAATTAHGEPTPTKVLAHARREVIICAGAFRSPQLLMLSGIGPRDHLASMAIACVHDLPAVGQHLTDHLAIPIMIDVPVRDTAQRLITDPWFAVRSFLQHMLWGSGFLATPTTEATIFARTSSLDETTYRVSEQQEDEHAMDVMDASRPANIPDVEIMLHPCNCISLTAPATSGRAYLTLYTTLVQACVDGGRLELASATDPTAHARVIYPTLGPHDGNGPHWQAMRKSVRLAMRIADEFVNNSGYPHPAALTFAPGMDMDTLSQVTRHRVGERPPVPVPVPVPAATAAPPPPAPKTWATVTDDEIDAYARETCQSSLHFTSTCRMANSAHDGVVDTRLRVFGLANLRIADASVLPKIPSAHTMAPTLMVAERCADFIKQDWGMEGSH